MESPRQGRSKILAVLSTWLLLAALPGAIASYSVGVGRADTTGPVAEIVFMGYAKMDQKGSGLHLRTFSRAFIIDDGEERFVFVSVDSAMIGNGVRQTVIPQRNLKPSFFPRSSLVLPLTEISNRQLEMPNEPPSRIHRDFSPPRYLLLLISWSIVDKQ
ncbi:neutral ceramidase-like [Frieseomelitta varia]|uniref:neutral ceramidase-like n=1 Tax=Frieseomelitta varia TaxID=561572 RepID=UPI001CB6A1C3|nr:neutral ceramidase-like [Frieseomelitta varia]